MKKKILDSSSAGVGIIDPCNNNFNQLYALNGSKLNRFHSKVNSVGIYKDETIRVSIWADSIFAAFFSTLQTYLIAVYPDKIFEFKNCILGGSGADYHSAVLYPILNWNPDLLIMAEWEGINKRSELAESWIRLFREKTSADIAIMPWFIYQNDMDFLYNDLNLTAWLTSTSYILRKWFYSIASKYNCEMIDWMLPVINDLRSGIITPAALHSDNTHPSALFISDYGTKQLDFHFGKLFQNENLHNGAGGIVKSIRLADLLQIPDISEITKSGAFVIASVNADKSYDVINTSEPAAYIEKKIFGIGLELAYFGGGIGEFGIAIDGQTPSALLKDYATSPYSFVTGPYKVIVDSNILSNAEISRAFEIEMLSASTYKVTDTTNSVIVLESGSIESDEVFAVTDGQLTIPSNYAGITNWRGTLVTGAKFTFNVMKNWYDTIEVIEDSLTHVLRIFGLERKEYTVRITCNSGSIFLDSITELN